MRLAAAFLLVAAGCGDNAMNDGGPPDGAVPVDAAAADALDRDAELACEQAVIDGWRKQPPSLGIASPSSAAAFDAITVAMLQQYDIPGGAVAVIHDGKLVFAKGYGFADRDAPELVHPDDLFRIASLSKQVTAAEILTLVDAGKLSLDDKPFEIFADLQPLPNHTRNPDLVQITVRNLLQHTGGWNRDQTGDPMFMSPEIASALGTPGPASCEDTIRYMLDKPLSYAPGSTTCYSNFGYCVLGRVVERKAGVPYDQAVHAALLDPLGATRMRLGKSLAADRADGEVRYYDFAGAPLADPVFPSVMGQVPWPYGGFAIEAMDSHGGWIASPIDMLRFQVGVDGRAPPADLISPAAIAAMIADPMVPSCNPDGTTTPPTPGYWYGFGWSVNQYDNWWHSGSLPGTSTWIVRDHGGYGFALFFNTRPQDSGPLFSHLDQDPWTALGKAPPFLDGDWFDQYGEFTAWMDEATFADAVAQAVQAGRFPSRIEARPSNPTHQLRAELVPLHAGADAKWSTLADCLAFRAEDAARKQQGYVPINLQWFTDSDGLRRFQSAWEKF